jgi:hypothetical protein
VSLKVVEVVRLMVRLMVETLLLLLELELVLVLKCLKVQDLLLLL